MTSRSAAIDALRVVGTIAIVAGHTWDIPLVRASIYSWHVPIFFFLTGYLWRARVRTPGAEAKNRARTLLLPYAAWLALITLLALALGLAGQPQGLDLRALQPILLGGHYVGKPFSAFWFVTALFVVAVALRILERGPRWLPWASAVVLLTVAYSTHGALAAIPEAIGTGLACLVFVMAGIVFRRSRDRFSRPVITGVVLLVVCAILIATGFSSLVDLKAADFGTPVLSVATAIAISIALLLLAEVLVPKLSQRIQAGLTQLAQVSLMVVLTHSAVLWLMRTPPFGSTVPPFGLTITFLVALLAPWAAALVLARTPLSPILIGIPQRPISRARTAHGR
ncbi:acyltransferase family protein [Cryobacterium sp. ZS14-85]|uniref:Acyltransferase family protein n=1 Tax=Cryobacterium zhongshanensis TaxID=2928153 RepID=A0AA41QWY5_9MICO|nr:acyltransferase family protein [Cryobacterium zhongshanensis]